VYIYIYISRGDVTGSSEKGDVIETA